MGTADDISISSLVLRGEFLELGNAAVEGFEEGNLLLQDHRRDLGGLGFRV